MRLIVGLGNPDPEYQWSPHNLGFLAVDELANRSSIHVERPEGKALIGLGKLAGEDVVLAKPQTYMNLSGVSVRDLLERYELGPEDLLVLYDERDLPWGMIRIGERGSPGTHNGAKSVTSSVGTQEFARLRLGCGPDHPVGDLAAYVLRPMKKAELEVAAEMIATAGDAVETILTQGLAAAMNKFNRRVTPPEEPL
jgi:PTH1 family peptidyl-tRNA hydrolase